MKRVRKGKLWWGMEGRREGKRWSLILEKPDGKGRRERWKRAGNGKSGLCVMMGREVNVEGEGGKE